MAIAGTLEIQLMAGVARLTQDMTQAKAVVGSAMANIEKSVSQAKTVLASLGVGVGVGAFVALIKGSIDAMDHLNDLHKTLDISVEKLTGLKLLSKQTGGDLDSLAASIAKLSVNAGKDPEKFAALGITAKDNVEAFKQLADILNRTVDPQQKSAIAQAALGRAWMGSMPALSEGSKRIEEIIEKGARLAKTNAVMTQAADDFNDKLAELSAASSGTVSSLVGGLLPALTMVANNFELVRNLTLSLIAVPVVLWLAGITMKYYEKVAAMVASVAATQAERAATIAKSGADIAAAESTLAFIVADRARAVSQLQSAQATIAATAAMGAQSSALAANAVATAANSAAMSSLAALGRSQATTTAQLAAAQAAHTTALAGTGAAAGVLRGALGLLGGPIGWITLALGLGATAWAFWGKSAEDAGKQAEESLARGLALAKRLQDQAKFGSGDTGVLSKALVAAKQKFRDEMETFAAARGVSVDYALSMSDLTKSVTDAWENVSTLETSLKQAGAATKGLTDEQKKQAAANEAFLKTLRENKAAGGAEVESPFAKMMNALLEEELKLKGELTTVDRLALDIGKMKLKEFEKLTIAELVELEHIANNIDLMKEATVALDAYVKSMEADAAMEQETADFMAARDKVVGDAILSTSRLIEQMEFETALIGKTNVERETAIFLRQAEIDKIDEATIARGKEAIAARNSVQEANDAADKMERSQVDMWRDIDRVAHDTFVSIFDSGKSAFDRLRDTLKNGLYSLLYNMTLKPFLIQIVTSTAGAGVAQSVFPGAAGAGGGAGGIGNIFSAGSSLSNLATGGGIGASLFGSAGAYAAAVPSLTSAAVGSQAALLASQTGVFAAEGLAATISSAGGAAGASAAVSALGVAMPYIGAAIAIGSLLGVFGSKKTPAIGTGYLATGATTGGNVDTSFFGGITNKARGEPLADQADNMADLAAVLKPAVEELGKVARALGVSSERFAAMRTSFSGEVSGIGQEHVDKLNQVVTLDVVNQLAEQIIPGIKDFQRENEQLVETLARVGAESKLVDEILELIGKPAGALAGTGTAALKLKDDLITLMGGLQSAAAQTQSYYANFFTESERFAIDLGRVNDAMVELGITDVKTRAQFRARVEAQDLSTRSGQEMFSALMALSPAFAAVTVAIEDVVFAAGDLASQITAVQSAALDAVSEQIRLSGDAARAAHQSADAYRQAGASMLETIRKLRGGDLSPLLPGQKLAESRTNLDVVFQRALSGDKGALAALPEIATDFLEASRAYNASSTAYTADFTRVMAMLEQAGTASDVFAGTMDYQATLLDVQTVVLEQIRDLLRQPDASLAQLTQQVALLTSVQQLLTDSTRNLITINSSVLDQTGHVITGNSLISAQTGEITAIPTVLRGQTSMLLAGNYMVTDPQTGQLVNITVDQAGRITSVRDALGAQTTNLLAGNYMVTDPQAGLIIRATIDQSGFISTGNASLIEQAQALLASNMLLLNSNGQIREGTYLLQTQTGALITATANQLGQIISVADLTRTQTGQIDFSNVLLNALTGQVILGNTTADAATGEVVQGINVQTGRVIAGNTTADAIRNISALNRDLTEEMLISLIANTSNQTGIFGFMLDGLGTTNTLLLRLVGLAEQRSAADAEAVAAVEAESDRAIALAQAQSRLSAASATQATQVAGVNAGISGINSLVAQHGVQQLTAAGGQAQQLYVQDGLLQNMAEYQLLGGNSSGWVPFRDEFWRPGGVYDQTYGRAAELQSTASNIDALRQQVIALGGVPSHATGLPYVPYDDYLFLAHKGEAILPEPQATQWRSGGTDNAELVSELRSLRAEVARVEARIAQSADRSGGELENQTKRLEVGLKQNARDTGREIESAAEAQVRR